MANQRVKVFSSKYSLDLENEINKFAETHKIIQISYSREKYFSCMVLYEK